MLWDFVELPSQIMENWLTEEEALNVFAKHHETRRPLPKELLDKMLASHNFNAATGSITQLRYANLDFDWHLADPESITDVDEFETQSNKRFMLLPKVDGTNMSSGFAHIFAGGYAAGYYSYKWAEALDADAWSMFQENGIFNTETADKFREYILARGNAYPPQDLFEAFRGRSLDADALLKRDGLL